MKKLIAFLSATLMLVAVAAPALAVSSGIKVQNNNWAVVTTSATASSNTGHNNQTDMSLFGGSNAVNTGTAYSNSQAESLVNQNVNTVRTWGLVKPVAITNNNGALVTTGAVGSANTGNNSQIDHGFGCNTNAINSGAASSYGAAAGSVNGNSNTITAWGSWIW